MGRRRYGVCGAERGAAAVEFAFILPLLVTLLIGIMEFGYLLNQQISLSQAAREGARVYALHHGDPAYDLQTVVKEAAPTLTGITAAVHFPPDVAIITDGSCPSGQTVQVEVTEAYASLTGLFDFIPATLKGEAGMICGG